MKAPSSNAYIRKAERALAAARVLVKAGDADGACNRAYYAMFDAAHAALFSLQAENVTAPIKTHNGLVAQFGRHVVLAGHLSDAHGEALNKVQRLRLVADYSGDSISLADAQRAVEHAEAFVAAVKKIKP